MAEKWKPPERNYDGIQFAELRKAIEKPYLKLHDELSDCFYNKKPFRNYGLLDKETFDELHGLISHHLAVKFHEENMKQKLYDPSEYQFVGGVDQIELAKSRITEKEKKGFKLKL